MNVGVPSRPSARGLAECAGRRIGLTVLLLASCLAPVAAQDGPNEGSVGGVVVDALTGAPIAAALVVVDDERRAVLTDSLGAFDFGWMEGGPLTLSARRYGYQAQGMHAIVPHGGALVVEIPLPPEAVLLDGIEVVTERLQTMDQRLTSRRRALAASSRAFEQERLVRSGARDFLEFLLVEASLRTQPCGRRASGAQCVRRRGGLVQPRVYLDEMPIIGGLDHLASYQPYDLYLVEVYGAGVEIRAYTHFFMERMARRPVALMPIMQWW
jgi:hypothetical protein